MNIINSDKSVCPAEGREAELEIMLASWLAVLCGASVAARDPQRPLSDEFIDLINARQTTWTAGRNFHPDTTIEVLRNLMGLIPVERKGIQNTVVDAALIASLPESFDARDKWPDCPSINEIRDQADCASCWAFAAVEAMTDRVCIHSNGTRQFHVSASDVLTCGAENGCRGAVIGQAWKYWNSEGIVSGGSYGSRQGCKPYPISPCEHHVAGPRRNCSLHEVDTPPCKAACETNYNVSYENDKLRGSLDYLWDEDMMKANLFQEGPIVCGYEMYKDFYTYKSGVYKHIEGKFVGYHAVKIIGWGVENGVKYWLCANSWNVDWGDKGFFKILRGEDHVGIEYFCVSGMPSL